MIFGRSKLRDAHGAILAHSLTTPEVLLKKGAMIDDRVLGLLTAAGYAFVTIARLEPGDVSEEEAAYSLSDQLLAPFLLRSPVVHGRANLFASTNGLLKIDTARITQLNLVDESIALATLPNFSVVKKNTMIATLKVIPFAVSGEILARARDLIAEGAALFDLKPFQPLRAGLIITTLPQLKPSIIAGTIGATQARVLARGGTLLQHLNVAHDATAIALGIKQLLKQGVDLILISGASAVTDRLDTVPQAIVQAGGSISHFGMPVDPGNLICFGCIADKPAIVLPGCARSPALNGIDWVLDRLFAGEVIGAPEIAAMGAGGLLKESKLRPTPRHARTTPHDGSAPASLPEVAALVLAAGTSSRMRGGNKLLARMPDGKSMIAQTVDNVLASGAWPVIVVTGHMDHEIKLALAARPVRFLHAPNYAYGLSASLKAGVSAIAPESDAVLICLGDMPFVDPPILQKLLGAYEPASRRQIIIPVFNGQRGNPVLWGRRFFPDILKLSGDCGARQIMDHYTDFIAEVSIDKDAILRDFDTRDSLAGIPASVTV